MASWQEVQQAVRALGAEAASPQVLVMTIQGATPQRTQTLYLSHELIPPGFPIVKIYSAVAYMGEIDANAILSILGDLQIGSFGHNPTYSDGERQDGFMTLSTSIPLEALQLGEPTSFLLYLNIFAQAADRLQLRIFGDDAPDRF